MHVFDDHVIGDSQIDMRKVPDGPYVTVYKRLGNLNGARLRYGQNRDIDIITSDKVFKFFHRSNIYISYLLPYKLGIPVKYPKDVR